jgi:hypothetical protein
MGLSEKVAKYAMRKLTESGYLAMPVPNSQVPLFSALEVALNEVRVSNASLREQNRELHDRVMALTAPVALQATVAATVARAASQNQVPASDHGPAVPTEPVELPGVQVGEFGGAPGAPVAE